MTPDEVRMLDNRYALLFIRGEFPVRDLKYDILKHPNIRFTTDGQGKPYIHGEDTRSIATLTLTPELLAQASEYSVEDHNYVLFCEEELQEIFEKQGGKQT
jgi:type IV secretion system protein VirD4